MKTKTKILWIVSSIPLVITLFILRYLPDELPMHYDIEGNIDRWGSKYEELFMPITIIVLTLILQLMMNWFTGKQKKAKTEKEALEAESNWKIIWLTALCIAVVNGILHFYFLYSGCVAASADLKEAPFDVHVVTNVLFGIVFIIVGNYLPRTKVNSLVGFRTAKTMKDEEVWKKANRFAGILFMIAGVLVIAAALLIGGMASTLIMIGILLVVAVIAIVYSCRL